MIIFVLLTLKLLENEESRSGRGVVPKPHCEDLW